MEFFLVILYGTYRTLKLQLPVISFHLMDKFHITFFFPGLLQITVPRPSTCDNSRLLFNLIDRDNSTEIYSSFIVSAERLDIHLAEIMTPSRHTTTYDQELNMQLPEDT